MTQSRGGGTLHFPSMDRASGGGFGAFFHK
jgi:hypothetical protein